MPIYVIGTAPGGGQAGGATVGGRTGGPREAAPWLYRPRLWYPGAAPDDGLGPDTLFILDLESEQDAIERGAMFCSDGTNYFSASQPKAELVPGPFYRKAIAETADSEAIVQIPSVGILPDPTTTSFTVEFRATPRGMSGEATATGRFLWAGIASGNHGLFVYKGEAGADSLTAAWRVAATLIGKATIDGLVEGDWPADTPLAFSVTWNHSTRQLILRLGNNAKSATGSAIDVEDLPPWWISQGGWIAPLTGSARTELSGEWELSELRFAYGLRRPGATVDYIEVPAIHVDAETPDGDGDLRDLAGVFAQYPGWRDPSADGATGGNGPGIAGTEIRDQLAEVMGADGLRLVRIDHIFDKVTITGSFEGGYSYDWSAIEEPMDLFHAQGMRFHVTLGYTPFTGEAALGGSRSANPSSHAAFARMCSDFVAWAESKGYDILALTLWNEPESGSFWAGTPAQFASLWQTVKEQSIADEWPWPLGGSDGNIESTKSDGTHEPNEVVDTAQAEGLPLEFVGYHSYESDEAIAVAEIEDIHDYLDGRGFTDVPIRVGEWADQRALSFWGSVQNTSDIRAVRGSPNSTPAYAAWALRRIVNFRRMGVASAIFTRMCILDDSYVGEEQMYGLFTHDNPPRPLPIYALFQAMWKLAGDPVTVEVNRPNLLALASRDDDGTITVVYGSHREFDADRLVRANLTISGLPASFTWRQWRMDLRDADRAIHDGRLVEMPSGDETNLPLGVELTASGIGCIQITPA